MLGSSCWAPGWSRFWCATGGPTRWSGKGLKPLALAAILAVLSLLAQAVPGLRAVGVVGLVASVALGFPLALAVGALRYRVWDIDPILVTTIVYGVLTVLITAVYVGMVVGFAALTGSRSAPPALLPLIAATALVAILFAPVKDRVSRAAKRLVYGVRASPYEALAALPHQLSETPAVDEVLPRTADALTRGLGVRLARVRVFLAGAPRVSWSPQAPPGPDPDLVTVPVRHLGEVVGDVSVLPSPDRPLSSADRRLLADLAAQAGPALRGVALATELRARIQQITEQSAQLRASRQRLASAQVEERRRLERDIHDGAQQRLIAVAMSLQAVEDLLTTDPDAGREALQACRDNLGRCIDDLRELARGVYPPVLAARGLPAALRARVRAVGGQVRVQTSDEVDARRFGPDIELAVYFACLEAMQNAAKHVPDAAVTVELGLAGDTLRFAVVDGGTGFDPGGVVEVGSGLLGMADRIGAVGGVVTVDSAPGRGTAVRGQVPVTRV
jgi:signal transduction histidine kinase